MPSRSFPARVDWACHLIVSLWPLPPNMNALTEHMFQAVQSGDQIPHFLQE